MSVVKKFLLTIAGSDPTGGAGIQRDIKTFYKHRFYGLSVITSITIQGKDGVKERKDIRSDTVEGQLNTILNDFNIRGIKIGMLGNYGIVKSVSNILEKIDRRIPIVIDPIIFSSGGYPLLSKKAIGGIKKHLFPLSNLITPNIPESSILSGMKIKNLDDLMKAGWIIKSTTGGDVLIKGGHLREVLGTKEERPADYLFLDNEVISLRSKWIKGDYHGTGCILSSAILCRLVQGYTVRESVFMAKNFLIREIMDGECLLQVRFRR